MMAGKPLIENQHNCFERSVVVTAGYGIYILRECVYAHTHITYYYNVAQLCIFGM